MRTHSTGSIENSNCEVDGHEDADKTIKQLQVPRQCYVHMKCYFIFLVRLYKKAHLLDN